MTGVQQRVVAFLAPVARRGLCVCTAAAVLLAGVDVAYSGPCTAQIAALEQQIKSLPAGPKTGPTFSQTLAAQLHHQPTPEDVEHAQTVGRKEADAALKAAKDADAADNASACNAALEQAKRLYDIDQ